MSLYGDLVQDNYCFLCTRYKMRSKFMWMIIHEFHDVGNFASLLQLFSGRFVHLFVHLFVLNAFRMQLGMAPV